MKHKIAIVMACSFAFAACNFENYEDCQEDELGIDDDFEGGHSKAGKGPGLPGTGASNSGGTAGTGANPAEGGAASEPEPEPEPEPTPDPTACDSEDDCAPGENCDYSAGVCAPADAETCGELASEVSCTNRLDCTPIYAGTNCSCGADCECVGGEPGCVCEAFEFFACAAAEPSE